MSVPPLIRCFGVRSPHAKVIQGASLKSLGKSKVKWHWSPPRSRMAFHGSVPASKNIYIYTVYIYIYIYIRPGYILNYWGVPFEWYQSVSLTLCLDHIIFAMLIGRGSPSITSIPRPRWVSCSKEQGWLEHSSVWDSSLGMIEGPNIRIIHVWPPFADDTCRRRTWLVVVRTLGISQTFEMQTTRFVSWK